MTINKKLELLRAQMTLSGIDAIIIPSTDPHQSEYVADHWQERVWISGFSGSAGTVVVTHTHAGLWTDSRYFLQAESELQESEFVLHKMYNQFASPYIDFIVEGLSEGNVVAVNGAMFSAQVISSMKKTLERNSITFVYDEIDLITQIWVDRPPLSLAPVFIHDMRYAGVLASDKISQIRRKMMDQEVDSHFITALDDIAWTCNLRGNDVMYNPVFIAFLLITIDDATLFVDPEKITKDVEIYLSSQHISTSSYVLVKEAIKLLPDTNKILIDDSLCNQALYGSINAKIVHGGSIPKILKCCKNDVEINHIRDVMVKDGYAIAQTFYWLEKTLDAGSSPSEYEFANQLMAYRSQQENYMGESFGAIIGYESNGAVIHYHPEKNSSLYIKADGILLVDNGGQYLDGTTDTTRTIALSNPTQEQKRHYTLILKGMICLSNAKFPEGTVGAQLDTLARQYLWLDGLNYLHGTGHGVGFFLNVHEPPQGFAPVHSERGKTALLPGMITSNEPGYYLDGKYGMRIENLILTTKSKHDGFLAFETLTLYPFDHKLIEKSLMTDNEVEWINSYHKRVLHKIGDRMKGELQTWFEHKCRPMS